MVEYEVKIGCTEVHDGLVASWGQLLINHSPMTESSLQTDKNCFTLSRFKPATPSSLQPSGLFLRLFKEHCAKRKCMT